jgi:hypothetical protein
LGDVVVVWIAGRTEQRRVTLGAAWPSGLTPARSLTHHPGSFAAGAVALYYGSSVVGRTFASYAEDACAAPPPSTTLVHPYCMHRPDIATRARHGQITGTLIPAPRIGRLETRHLAQTPMRLTSKRFRGSLQDLRWPSRSPSGCWKQMGAQVGSELLLSHPLLFANLTANDWKMHREPSAPLARCECCRYARRETR